jgi:dihydropteroate synthase
MLFPPDRVTLVGVLNVTPDSFSDGGHHAGVAAAVAHARALAEAGAHVVDVGGESTRPGAEAVPADVERARVVPVIERIARELGLPVSVDTRKAEVAEAALAAGACAVNDVSGGRFDPALLAVAARGGADVVLGHLRGEPATMQREVRFDDVLEEVADELGAAVERAREAGVPRERIAVDPGIGFGKRPEHNLALLANAGALRERLGLPVLVGPSRKSFFAALTGPREPAERDLESHVAAAIAVFAGADAVRVHDVAGAARALAVARALRGARRKDA